MTEKNRNLLKRLASALLALPVVLFCLWKGGFIMAALVGFSAGVVVFEIYGMTLGRLDPPQVVGIAAAGGLPFAVAMWPERFGAIAAALHVGLTIVFLAYQLVRGEVERAPSRVSLLVFGVVYGGLMLTTVSGIRQFHSGVEWLVFLLAMTWLNDTGAYTFGRLFGRTKLAPSVSPSKTWEGFLGGMATSVGAAFAVRWVYFPELTVADCLVAPVACSVLGPTGDLCESMLKRACGVKDSGKIMPGHGGLLDRVDALLFNAPFVYVYILATRS